MLNARTLEPEELAAPCGRRFRASLDPALPGAACVHTPCKRLPAVRGKALEHSVRKNRSR